MADAFEHPRLGIIGPYPYVRTGGHTFDGFAIVNGPHIAESERGEYSAADLPPTILQLLDRAVPAWVEGVALSLSAECP
jgi:hypothetical protein